MMTETIKAQQVPVPQPEIPPCELWIAVAYNDLRGWTADYYGSETHCDQDIAIDQSHGITVRKFHLSDRRVDVDIDDAIMAAIKQHCGGIPLEEMLRDFARALGH